MNDELQAAYAKITTAVLAEDIFGPLGEATIKENLTQLEAIFGRIAQVLDPGNYVDGGGLQLVVTAALERLKVFYEAAKAKVNEQAYGQIIHDPGDFAISTDKRQYFLDGQLNVNSDISSVFHGSAVGGEDFTGAGQVAAKVIRDQSDDDLMINERRILQTFQANPAPQDKHLPVLLDYFKTSDGKLANVLRLLDGYSLDEVKAEYPNGVPEKHMVWMFKRILSVLGYVHDLGVVHGNIEPSHLLIGPYNHNVWLIDWCYASFQQSPFKVFNDDFSAPEVKEKKPPLPSADLYSAAKCMVYILGGDVQNNTMPETVHPDLHALLRSLLLISPLQRSQDAWEVYNYLDYLIVKLWGEKKFLDFVMLQPPLALTPAPIQLDS